MIYSWLIGQISLTTALGEKYILRGRTDIACVFHKVVDSHADQSLKREERVGPSLKFSTKFKHKVVLK